MTKDEMHNAVRLLQDVSVMPDDNGNFCVLVEREELKKRWWMLFGEELDVPE